MSVIPSVQSEGGAAVKQIALRNLFRILFLAVVLIGAGRQAFGQGTPTPTNTPTNTAVVPTSTPTNTPTNTAIVPTTTPPVTPTGTLIATSPPTPVAPTATPTAPGPTATATATPTPVVLPAVNVPALSTRALALMAFLLAVVGVLLGRFLAGKN